MHIWFACSAHMADGTNVMFRTGMELPSAKDLLLSTETLEEVEDLCVQHLADAGHEVEDVRVQNAFLEHEFRRMGRFV